jgi:PAS domain S-box-containing protein
MRNILKWISQDRFKMAILFITGGIFSYTAQKLRLSIISDAKQRSNMKLHESEQRLRLALDGGQMGMWEWIVGTNYSRWNEKKYELLGFPVGDGYVSTELFFKNLHPDDAAKFHCALQETLASEKDFSQEFRFTRPDGEVRWLIEKARLYREVEAKPSRMIGITYDITDRKLLEDELHARMNDMAVLMDTVPAVVLIAHDPKCRLIYCGLKARQLLRLPEGQQGFVPWQEQGYQKTFRLMKDGKELQYEEIPLRIAATGHEVRDFELTLFFNDGITLYLIGDAVPLFDKIGAIRGAIGAFVDITELKRTQTILEKERTELETKVTERTNELRSTVEDLLMKTEERARAMEELRDKDQLLIQQSRLAAMGEMINNIAHQWRQPLNSIALIIQELPIMYKKGEFNEEYLNAMIDKAKNHVFNMSRTIEDFKSFFEPNREKLEFRVRDAVAKTLALVKGSFDVLHIEVEVDEVGDMVIYGYANELSQVLVNIFLNSRDAFLDQKEEKSKIIKIRIFSRGDKIMITIADNAGGISEDVIDKIFEPYFTTKGPGKGTGIGLFMAKTIIERHMNGRLSAQNIKGGVEFIIEIVPFQS